MATEEELDERLFGFMQALHDAVQGITRQLELIVEALNADVMGDPDIRTWCRACGHHARQHGDGESYRGSCYRKIGDATCPCTHYEER